MTVTPTHRTRSHKSSFVGRKVVNPGVCTADLTSVTSVSKQQQAIKGAVKWDIVVPPAVVKYTRKPPSTARHASMCNLRQHVNTHNNKQASGLMGNKQMEQSAVISLRPVNAPVMSLLSCPFTLLGEWSVFGAKTTQRAREAVESDLSPASLQEADWMFA
ncbi:hypothetical protein EYF80_024101 [Liparis tanakae]|uniref:Uncharacterized protein n=1 Tax=Liparis tanakae TaxID=230148 RepID=A0A4Z2HIU6_9TELE|nr:hypothetical protein EYF80_024101 [Liparis tanakae]